MKKIYVWEFWFSENLNNKRIWYIEKKDWEYKLIISEGFFPKNIQSCIRWKTIYSKEVAQIIHWKIMNNNDLISQYEYVSLVWLSFFDSWLDIIEYNFKYLIFWFHFQNLDDINFNNFSFNFNWLSELVKSLLIKKRVSKANNGVVTNNPVVDKLLLKYQGREGMLDDKMTKLTTKTTTRKK